MRLRAHIGIVEQLEIGHQAARPDAEHEAALAHVVELSGFGRHDRGMMIGQVDDGGAERNVPGARKNAGEEHHRGGDRLGGGGEMLAQPQLVEAELIGEHRFPAILRKCAPEHAVRRMDRHHEHSQAHALLRTRDRKVLWPVPAAVKMAGWVKE